VILREVRDSYLVAVREKLLNFYLLYSDVITI